MLIHNARLVGVPISADTADEPHWIAWDDGRITGLGVGDPPDAPPTEVIDAAGCFVLPGFIDIHVHGAVGHDVMDADPAGLAAMARFFAAHGVTGWLPTTLTHEHEALMAALNAIKARMADPVSDGAAILGARLEGPYLNRAKAGAQNPQYIRPPHPDEVQALLDLDVIRVLDVAPEIAGADWLIAECARRGVVTSAAHTDATAEQLLHAHALGLANSTHTFNAQSPLHHRQPGVVGAVLATPTISAELICDGIHVHPLAVAVLAACKRDRVILITDAVRAAGMPDGDYTFDERVIALRDGAVRLPDGTLAGSALTMDRAVRHYAAYAGGLHAAAQAASLAPARLLGIADRKGSLETGKDADLVVIDDDFNVVLTVVGGRIVYQWKD
jgi:N-acetylglucosamine-6-phosphate deacetylase